MIKKNWSFALTTDLLKENWGQWSYLKIAISTKSLMSIPFGGGSKVVKRGNTLPHRVVKLLMHQINKTVLMQQNYSHYVLLCLFWCALRWPLPHRAKGICWGHRVEGLCFLCVSLKVSLFVFVCWFVKKTEACLGPDPDPVRLQTVSCNFPASLSSVFSHRPQLCKYVRTQGQSFWSLIVLNSVRTQGQSCWSFIGLNSVRIKGQSCSRIIVLNYFKTQRQPSSFLASALSNKEKIQSFLNISFFLSALF